MKGIIRQGFTLFYSCAAFLRRVVRKGISNSKISPNHGCPVAIPVLLRKFLIRESYHSDQ